MSLPLDQLYLNHAKALWVLFDLRDPEACKHLHEQRAAWQGLSDLAALGPDHMVLLISPGGTARGSAITKEAQSG